MNIYLLCIDDSLCLCIKADTCDEAKKIVERRFPEAKSIRLKVDTFARDRAAVAPTSYGDLSVAY